MEKLVDDAYVITAKPLNLAHEVVNLGVGPGDFLLIEVVENGPVRISQPVE